MAEQMVSDKANMDAERESSNPNAGFRPINEPVEQQAPLDHGMPPAPTGMTVAERRKAVQEEAQQKQKKSRGTRNSYEQPEVVVVEGTRSEHEHEHEHAVTAFGHDAYEA